ncbi:hypothetical protein Tco_0901688 [Tanacetum coccineum]
MVEGSEVRAKVEIAQESSLKRAGTKLEQVCIKKQKLDKDKETTELQRLIEVVLDKEEVAIDAIPLATKPPSIVDYKIHKEGKKTYYHIIRADRSLKMYLVFSHMLKSFDRKDLETLWKLVKANHGSTWPYEGYGGRIVKIKRLHDDLEVTAAKLTFNQYVDAQSVFAAIKARFGSNEATKKTQKALLKQQAHRIGVSFEWGVTWQRKSFRQTLGLHGNSLDSERILSLKLTTGCDKESDNSKENTEDSLKKEQVSDIESSSIESPLKLLIHIQYSCPNSTEEKNSKWEYNVTKRPVNNVRSVNTGRPFSIARSFNTARPFYTAHPKSTIHYAEQGLFYKLSTSTGLHPFYNENNIKQKVVINQKVLITEHFSKLNDKGFVDSRMLQGIMTSNIAPIFQISKTLMRGYVTFSWRSLWQAELLTSAIKNWLF